jgi:hypothetical protein
MLVSCFVGSGDGRDGGVGGGGRDWGGGGGVGYGGRELGRGPVCLVTLPVLGESLGYSGRRGSSGAHGANLLQLRRKNAF